MTKAKILRLHFSDGQHHEGKPLHEAVVAKCRQMDVAGATVFRGFEGYGQTADIQRHPIIVLIVDTEERIRQLLPTLEELMDTGMIAINEVEMIRVQRS